MAKRENTITSLQKIAQTAPEESDKNSNQVAAQQLNSSTRQPKAGSPPGRVAAISDRGPALRDKRNRPLAQINHFTTKPMVIPPPSHYIDSRKGDDTEASKSIAKR